MNPSESYNPDACCGNDCYFLRCEDCGGPCWGDVEPVGEECTEDYEDCWWIHACQGHLNLYRENFKTEFYIAEPDAFLH